MADVSSIDDSSSAHESIVVGPMSSRPLGTYEYDTGTEVVDCSPQARLLFGLDGVEPRRDTLMDRIHPDDRDRVEQHVFRSLYPGGHDHVFRVRHADGGVRWIRDTGQVVFDDASRARVVGIVQDVTDGKRAEEALRESEHRFRAMADHLPLIVWLHDEKGNQQFVNRTFCEFFGVTQEEMRGGRWQFLMHPEDASVYSEAFASAVRDQTSFHGEVRVKNGADEWRWLESWGRPRFDDDGRFLGHVGTSADVTERKRAEKILREREEEARRERLAERRRRIRAEMLSQTTGEMEKVWGLRNRTNVLLDALVPRLADVAVAVLPGMSDYSITVSRAADALASDLRQALDRRREGDVLHAVVEEVVGPHSVLDVPFRLPGFGEARLLLALVDRDRSGFEDDEREFLERLANHAALIMGNALVQRRERTAVLRLQEALLPHDVVAHHGIAVARRYVTGSDTMLVGGDWYDTLTLDDGRIGFTVGDVVGHGIGAAAAMGRVRTALVALAPHASGPGDLLGRLQRYVVERDVTDFATACYAILDPRSGHLEYSSAGHPPGIVVSPDGTATWLEDGVSPPLCWIESDHPDGSAVLEEGSLLVLYTDGLVERRGRSIDDGMEDLRQKVVAYRDADLDSLCDRLAEEMATGEDRDDVAILALRYLGPAVPD